MSDRDTRARRSVAGASAISHDLYARVIKKGTATSEQELKAGTGR